MHYDFLSVVILLTALYISMLQLLLVLHLDTLSFICYIISITTYQGSLEERLSMIKCER